MTTTTIMPHLPTLDFVLRHLDAWLLVMTARHGVLPEDVAARCGLDVMRGSHMDVVYYLRIDGSRTHSWFSEWTSFDSDCKKVHVGVNYGWDTHVHWSTGF